MKYGLCVLMYSLCGSFIEMAGEKRTSLAATKRTKKSVDRDTRTKGMPPKAAARQTKTPVRTEAVTVTAGGPSSATESHTENMETENIHPEPLKRATGDPSKSTPLTSKRPEEDPGEGSGKISAGKHPPKNLEKKNLKGETPLHAAAVRGDTVALQRYLGLGADPNTTDHAGWTPLHEAAGAGTVPTVCKTQGGLMLCGPDRGRTVIFAKSRS
jgi:hypothetical protein